MSDVPVTGVQRPEGDPPVLSAKPDWKMAISRAKAKFSSDQCTDLAAALTYYSVQAMFPAIIAGVSLLGLFGDGKATTKKVVETIASIAGKQPSDLKTVSEFIDNLQTSSGAGVAFILGVLMALWSASGYVGAFSRMQNRIYDVAEGRSVFKLRPWLYLVTVIQVIMLVIVAMAMVLSGPVAKEIGGLIGLGEQAVLIWDIVKWPFVAIIVMLIIGLMFWATPNVKRPFKQAVLNPGALLAFFIWALGSAAFAWYVSNMGNYGKTYGPMATPIILLLWLWITNLAMLFGAEFDAEVLRTRQLKSGYPAEELVLLPVRDDKGIVKKQEKYDESLEKAHELRLSSGVSESDVAGMLPVVPGKRSDERTAAAQETSPEKRPETPSAKTVEQAPDVAEARGGVRDADTSTRRESEKAGTSARHGGSAEALTPEEEQVADARDRRRRVALALAQGRREKRDAREAHAREVAAEQKRAEAELAKERKEREQERDVTQQWAETDAARERYAHPNTREFRAVSAEREARRREYFSGKN